MGVAVDVVRVACNTATGTQDITGSVGGLTPKAAIFILTLASSDGVAANGMALSCGFCTGATNRSALGVADDDAQATTVTYSDQTTTGVIQLKNGAGTTIGFADFSAWLTDGVRINWTTAPGTAYLLTVILFAGSDLSAHADTFNIANVLDNTVDVTAPGFEPDVLFVASTMGNSPAGHYEPTFGLVHNNGAGTITQRGVAWTSQSAVAESRVSGAVRNDAGAIEMLALNNTGFDFWAEFHTFDASGFSASARNAAGNNRDIRYLALSFGGAVGSAVITHSTPTSTGNNSETGVGFKPQFVLMLGTFYSAFNAGDVGLKSGARMLAAWDATEQFANSFNVEDAAATTNTQSLSDNVAVELPTHSGAAGVTATLVSFDTNGWTLNYSAVQAEAKLFLALAIEEEAGGAGFSPSVSDSVAVSDTPTIDPIAIPDLALSEAISVTEFVSLSVGAEPDLNIVAGETITVTATPVVEMPLATWPTLPDQSGNFWHDHFPGTSLDARWTAVTGGDGAVAVAGSVASLSWGGTNADLAFIYTPLDWTKSWTIAWSQRISALSDKWDALLYTDTVAPVAGGFSTVRGKSLMRFFYGVVATLDSWRLDRWPTTNAADREDWDGSTNAWVAPGVSANQPIAADDYYVFGLEHDAVNARTRAMIWHRTTTGAWSFDQGLRLFALTDWVADSYYTKGISSNVYLCVGKMANDLAGAMTLDIEWARHSYGPKIHSWVNQRAITSGNYNIRKLHSYDAQFFVPKDRTTTEVANAKDPFVIYDDLAGYYHMFGLLSTGGLGHWTATDPEGPWTANSGNPIIGIPVGRDGGGVSPFVVKDMSETNTNRRWKILFGATDSSPVMNYIYSSVSPQPTGTPPHTWSWTTPVLELSSQAGAEGKGVSNPVVIWHKGKFEIWYGALSDTSIDPLIGQWRTLRATGADVDDFSRDGAGVRVDLAPLADAVVTNISNRTLTVSSVTGFEVDGIVIVDDDAAIADWNTSRIRSINIGSKQIELYHKLNGYSAGTLVSIRNASFQWTPSGTGTNEYYLEAAGGGNPGISQPLRVLENSETMRYFTPLGSLLAGTWGYGDNDTLGFSTIYVRLSDEADPDSKATDFIQYCATGAAIVRQWDHASVYPKMIVKVGSEWWFYTTPFGLVRDDPSIGAEGENTGLRKHTGTNPIDASFDPDWTVTPSLSADDFGGDASLENMTLLTTPVLRATYEMSVEIPADSVVVADSATVAVVTDVSLSISVSDGITLTDLATVAPLLIPDLSQSEVVSIVDSSQTDLELTVQASEAITVVDSTSVVASDPQIGETQAVSITDAAALDLTVEIAESEAVPVSDTAALSITDPQISQSEAVTLAEAVDTDLTIEISASDAIVVSEAVTVAVASISDLVISTSEAVTVAENASMAVSDPQISQAEAVTVVDSTTLDLEIIISEAEAAIVADAAAIDALLLLIFPAEAVTVMDSSVVVLEIPGELNVSVSDDVLVADPAQLSVSASQISESETVSVADVVATNLMISVSAAEAVSISDATFMAVSDPQVAVSDSAAVAEFVALAGLGPTFLDIDVSDAVSVLDAASISLGILDSRNVYYHPSRPTAKAASRFTVEADAQSNIKHPQGGAR